MLKAQIVQVTLKLVHSDRKFRLFLFNLDIGLKLKTKCHFEIQVIEENSYI